MDRSLHGFVVILLVCLGASLALGGCQPAATPATDQLSSAAVLPSPTSIPTPFPGAVYIDAGQSLGAINPLVYGSNHGPWIAVPPDMLDEAAQAGVTVVRFPGGAWGDNNDLKPYQIDYFMSFLEQIGAEASISVRLKGGTPEQAAELVRYNNIEKGYRVHFWSIGNEPTLFAAELRAAGKADDYTTEQFNQEWRAFALAMKAVDPSILLIGPELHQWSADPAVQPRDSGGRNWMVEFLRHNGDLVDIVSFHRYPFPTQMSGGNATVDDLRRNTLEWDETIRELRSLIRQHTGRDLPVAVTEVNSHWSKAVGGEGTPDSHYNAIWWADVLGRLIRQGVFMVNHWMLTSSGGYGGWGLVSRGEVRPTYYVYQLYKQFGDEQVYASSDDPLVSVCAARRADGALTVLLVNLSDDEQVKPIKLDGVTPALADVWLFDEQHSGEQVGTLDLAQGEVSLARQSVTLLVLPRK